MLDSGLTPSDVLSLTRNDGYNDNVFGNGGGIIILILFLLLAGGNGFGFGNRRDGSNCATEHDIVSGFNFNQLDNGIHGLERGICDLGYSVLQQTNAINSGINQLGFQAQQCCCETNRNIDAVRYEAAQNTCAITTAIHNEGEQTRALINANTMQQLRDENQAFRLQLSNQAQTASLIATLRPFPQPAYITCSPYTSMCGCGCGCNGTGNGTEQRASMIM